MEYPRCRTCKHWTQQTEAFDIATRRLGTCERWRRGYGVESADVADNEALVEDDEGWGNLTGPDFGCVLHEVKS